MSFLLVTIPVSLFLAATLLGVVIWAVRTGAFDDWQAPAERHSLDDDSIPERGAPGAARTGDPR
jgi:cbb3-type cytochrome oxidase maturation protein